MPFKPGQSGNPQGRAIDKTWRDALRKAACEIDPLTKKRKIETIAHKVVTLAMEGDMVAVQEIGNRLDGRPKVQEDDIGTEENPFNVAFKWAVTEALTKQ